MNFLPRDICEKLVERGCESESFFFWQDGYGLESDKVLFETDPYLDSEQTPAFIFQDFCGISELAKKNIQILFQTEQNFKVDWGHDLESDRDDSGVKIFRCSICGATANKDSIYFGSEMDLCPGSLKQARYKMLDMTWDEWVEFMRKSV